MASFLERTQSVAAAEYRELLRDPATTTVWYVEPVTGLDASSLDAFELVQCTINGSE